MVTPLSELHPFYIHTNGRNCAGLCFECPCGCNGVVVVQWLGRNCDGRQVTARGDRPETLTLNEPIQAWSTRQGKRRHCSMEGQVTAGALVWSRVAIGTES